MKTLLLLLLASSAYAGPQINGNQINPASSITVSSITLTGAGITLTKANFGAVVSSAPEDSTALALFNTTTSSNSLFFSMLNNDGWLGIIGRGGTEDIRLNTRLDSYINTTANFGLGTNNPANGKLDIDSRMGTDTSVIAFEQNENLEGYVGGANDMFSGPGSIGQDSIGIKSPFGGVYIGNSATANILIKNDTTTVMGSGGVNVTYGITASTLTATTSLTVPGQVLVSSGARVSALGVGTDIPASGVKVLTPASSNALDTSDGVTRTSIYNGALGSLPHVGAIGTYTSDPFCIFTNAGACGLIQTAGGSVGIGTASPGSTLDVNGTALVRSSFSVAGTTFTVANSGIVSAPSQPAVVAYLSGATTSIPNATWTSIFFDTNKFDHQFNHSVSVSSNIITVPATGLYSIECQAGFSGSSATGDRIVSVFDGAGVGQYAQANGTPTTATNTTVTARALVNATAGDSFQCRVYQSSGGSLNVLNATFPYTHLAAVKLW